MSRYFLITPFGTKQTENGDLIDFNRVQKELVEPATKAAQLEGGTTGTVIDAGSIHEDMFQLIIESETVICDVTLHNANVWYELGIRHALRRKNTILIKGTPSDDTPFDVLTYRYVRYDASDPGKSVEALTRAISETTVSERETDSPVFKMLPKLEQPDPEKIQAVPSDFSEEVERAKAAQAVGWLRLLSDEVMGLRFQRPGLRLVGAAQMDIKDYDGAKETWEKVQSQIRNDIEANLALANILERMHRRTEDPVTLTESDQAVRRALDNPSLSSHKRAEALAFLGRNLKTRWRLGFRDEPHVVERRRIATNRLLMDSYNAYRDAFMIDLNHFWSGLAALQMNAIARDLSKDPAWRNAFRDADRVRENFEKDHRELTPIVAQGIRNGLVRKDEGDEWADVSEADLGFIVGEPAALLQNLYRDAIARDGFKLDAAVRQLELFQSLAVSADIAGGIIGDLAERFPKQSKTGRDQCVVVIAGHQIDESDRSEPRFPAAAEAAARRRLSDVLREVVAADIDLAIFASAASGTDLLAHEVCDEIGLQSTICLPIPPNSFAEKCYRGSSDWRTRFVRLTKRDQDRLRILSRSDGLPNWLRSKEQDPWRRGNCWVLEMAGAIPAKRHILIVLWDGKRDDYGGGTSHVVALAEKRGFEIVEIRTQELLLDQLY